MPVPGPRTQFAPVAGYRNPHHDRPTRLQLWSRPRAIVSPGRSPATMVMAVRGLVQAFGQIRRDWRQSINLTEPQTLYSWTHSAPGPDRPLYTPGRALAITRSLRYMTRSVYMGAGIDNTRYAGIHSRVPPKVRSKYATVGAGIRRNPPTVRNRLTSFGSRVATLNQKVDGAQ